jgi:hypothetical protein
MYPCGFRSGVPLSVFVSHSVGPREGPLVDRISAGLTGARVAHYVAKYDRQPGNLLSAKVREHVEASSVLFAVITAGGNDSAYVHEEIGCALGRHLRVIAFVEKGQWEGAMLDGVEQIPFDPGDPESDVAAATEYLARLRAEADLVESQAQARALQERAEQAELAALLIFCGAIVLLIVFSRD